MKLLLDHNLSPRLVGALSGVFPGIAHVALLGLERASDLEVWNHARENGQAIISKDSDFSDLAMLHGTPPKVVWLRVGNCTTSEASKLILGHREEIEAFLGRPDLRVLLIGPKS